MCKMLVVSRASEKPNSMYLCKQGVMVERLLFVNAEINLFEKMYLIHICHNYSKFKEKHFVLPDPIYI